MIRLGNRKKVAASHMTDNTCLNNLLIQKKLHDQ